MPEITASDNTKQAVAFLKTLIGNRIINIVAIDPHNGSVTGLTRHVDNDAISKFIEQHNGKRNLYYSVNSPLAGAPDNKLKKEHIAEINAVWIDADPDKDKPFEEERKRLMQFARDLMDGENPPTVITDSGGGIQAFWFLDKPVPATDENRAHYEALSRGLADQYGTDYVHNIDRIMRIPHTWNIPTSQKKGRKTTLARATNINPVRYSSFAFITPSEIDESTGAAIDYSKLKMQDVKKPLDGDLLNKFEQLRARNEKVDELWTLSSDWKDGDRSERDFTLAKELKLEGFTLEETAVVLWNYMHGKVQSVKYPAREIVRCYERSGNDFAAGLDPAHLARIEQQVNPLAVIKEAAEKMISQSELMWGIDATEENSGVPLFLNLMNQETVNVLYGPTGGGKSFVTLDMAVHLASGKDWAGFECEQKMAVLYFCTESGSSFSKRVKAARQRVGIPKTATRADFPFAYYYKHVNLRTNKDHLKLVEKLIDDLERESGHKCGLVIVDTLSAAFGGGDENGKDITEFQDNMAAIKFNKKTAILIVHHAGKDETAGARGHSSLKGNIDNEIRIKAEKRGEKWHRSIELTKAKDGETGNNKKFGLQIVELGNDKKGRPIKTCVVTLEGELGFDAVAPSLEEELDKDAFEAYRALRFYDAAISNPDIKPNFLHTELQAKCVIFTDLINGNGLFNVGVLGNNISSEWTKQLVQLEVMSLPSKTQLKAFSRALDKLRTKGIVKENRKYQLVNDIVDRLDNQWTNHLSTETS